ncbi:MAG: hypothetical protein ACP5JF_04285 [Candidatus Methanodesulfokora sp.]|jgi:aspartate kinase
MSVVVKVGGSVLRRPEDFVRAARNIRMLWVERGIIPIVVVSAMKGVTDRLIAASSGAVEELDSVEQKYTEVADELGSSLASRVSSEVKKIREILGELCCDELMRSYIVSLGEKLSRIAMVRALEIEGVRAFEVNAADVIVTDSIFDNATIIYNLTASKLINIMNLSIKLNAIPVIEGFVGANTSGFITTLGRGCSDYTATTIASLLGLRAYLVTDVVGVMTADPDLVPSARPVSTLSYDEAYEAACFGVKRLSPKAIEPLKRFYPSDVFVGMWNSWRTVIMGTRTERPKLLCNNGSTIAVIGHGVSSSEFALEILRLMKEHSTEVISMEFSKSRPLLRLSVDAKSENVKRILRDLHDELFVEVNRS